eukprot:CAMPEP_0172597102 /NCGR_PEP_ID=MMETSP1068-20121228/17046_1 /TAXON_ID=35684 /ORGANISM="Pseudopedinella elastica, Strain CCMP716" /LENGTH=41 /DNA_ID= /DNA_START= /DNA_END= /DNA_ORIENTATION=
MAAASDVRSRVATSPLRAQQNVALLMAAVPVALKSYNSNSQ